MNTIDTHSHFNLYQFDEDREAAIKRMVDAGVGTVCVGIDLETSKLAIEITLENPTTIWACVGQHPTEWKQEFDAVEFSALAEGKNVVAIGECGLDYFRPDDKEHKEEQVVIFRRQIELAIESGLPLMLHIRPEMGTMTAYEDALDILEEYKQAAPQLSGTAHFFAGDTVIAQRFIDLGFYISFSGVITFVKEYEATVAYVPLERILSETDAPFAAPAPYRGKRNEPAYVVEIVKKVAEIKGISLETVEKQLLQNAKDLFTNLNF
ncbi:MAG: sec-independent protein translocase protein TatD DNase family protein [Candidatus Nomurabacteria bacterium]|nr:sec-independent protein translocase protein TatD DNase family protein [Candidatus Nomurabacteria bacterium]